jgi:hypothetical protein
MKRQVWKYELQNMVFQLEIPKGGTILSLQMQKGIPCIWILVDIEAEKESRTFEVVGTGNPISHEEGQYVGTFQLQSGELVFHVFEVLNKIEK